MASRVLTNAYLLLNSVDLSTEVVGIDESFTTDTHDDTGMGVTSKEYVVGLDDATFSLDFKGEFGAGSVEATLWAIRLGRAAVSMTFASNTSTPAADNPVYTMNVILTDFGPIAGTPGAPARIRGNFQATGTISRDITP